MKTKRKEPAHVEERVVDGQVICDGCGRPIIDVPAEFAINEITITARIGCTIHEVDCCKSCFLTKVIPAFKAAGIKLRERDEDKDGRVWESDVALDHPPPPSF